jgi:hypothetical protein
MQTFLGLGSVATALGLIFTVWAWKMNASGANWMLATAWVLFGISIYSSVPFIAKQPVIPRALFTLFSLSLIGLILYYNLWTQAAPQAPAPQAPADTVFFHGMRPCEVA